MKKSLIISLMLISAFITGCDAIRPGVEDYTLPDEKLYSTTENAEAKRTVERLAEQEHIKPSLSDDFIQKHLNMESFDELKQRTKAGIAAVNDTADLTESEFQLWKDIIETERLNLYTTDDLEERTREIQTAIQNMASKKAVSLQDFLMQSYHMTPEEADAFMAKQAEKFALE